MVTAFLRKMTARGWSTRESSSQRRPLSQMAISNFTRWSLRDTYTIASSILIVAYGQKARRSSRDARGAASVRHSMTGNVG